MFPSQLWETEMCSRKWLSCGFWVCSGIFVHSWGCLILLKQSHPRAFFLDAQIIPASASQFKVACLLWDTFRLAKLLMAKTVTMDLDLLVEFVLFFLSSPVTKIPRDSSARSNISPLIWRELPTLFWERTTTSGIILSSTSSVDGAKRLRTLSQRAGKTRPPSVHFNLKITAHQCSNYRKCF